MKGVTIEPTGNSEKSDAPFMGFEPAIRGFETQLKLGFFRVPSGFNSNTFHLICIGYIKVFCFFFSFSVDNFVSR